VFSFQPQQPATWLLTVILQLITATEIGIVWTTNVDVDLVLADWENKMFAALSVLLIYCIVKARVNK